MNKERLNNRLPYIFLALIIVVGLCRFSYGFFVQKQSFHSDEAWSFGLANSYYEPYIMYTDDTSAFQNVDTWITGDAFREYLTVQEGERFSFDSVYYNMSCDTHPPLYFFLLHFLCSFFPNQYIFALGFLINAIAYVFMALFLYKLLKLMTSSNAVALVGTLFGTFSLAMLSMTMFVRMYMSVATLALIYTYLNAKLYYDESYRFKKSSYVLLGITALAGALTDSFFLPFAFAVTAVMCICWLVKKEFKIFAKYAVVVLVGIILSIVMFPRTFTSMLSFIDHGTNAAASLKEGTTVVNSSYRYMPVYFQFKIALNHVCREIFGITPLSAYNTYLPIYISCALFVLTIVLVFVAFLCRNERWFKALCIKILEDMKKFLKTFNFITFSMLCSVLLVCLSAAYITDLYGLGDFGDRYIFICMPVAIVLFVLVFWRIFKFALKKHTHLLIALLTLVLTFSAIMSNQITCAYFMQIPNTVTLEDISEDSNFIIISSSKWLLVQYAAKLYGCNEVFLTADYDFDNQWDNINNRKLIGDTYIIIDTTRLKNPNAEKAILDIGGLTPIYISTVFNSKPKMNIEYDNTYDLSSILAKCSEFSFVDKLTYLGVDGVNNYKLRVYKVN